MCASLDARRCLPTSQPILMTSAIVSSDICFVIYSFQIKYRRSQTHFANDHHATYIPNEVIVCFAISTANLRTKIMDSRGFYSSIILIVRGEIPRPIREFPGKFESSNVSRDNDSREIGCTGNTDTRSQSPQSFSGPETGKLKRVSKSVSFSCQDP